MPRGKNKTPTVVPAPVTTELPKAELTPRGRELIEKVRGSWQLDDVADQMLVLAAEAVSVSERLGVILEKEGRHFIDRWGQPRPHPLCTLEQQTRTSAANILAKLRLDLE